MPLIIASQNIVIINIKIKMWKISTCKYYMQCDPNTSPKVTSASNDP